MEELKKFWDFITCGKEDIHCLSSKEDYGFSKNFFTKTYERLERWTLRNKEKDCYMNYSPLKTGLNRTNANVRGIKMIALDIEFANKIKPEEEYRLNIMRILIEESIIEPLNIEKYMLICSGNGFHCYIPIGKEIVKETEIMKIAMKSMVKKINEVSNSLLDEDMRLSCDDRVDLAGILRIPGTMNTGANRKVTITNYKNEGENKIIRKKLLSYTKKAKVKMKKTEEIRKIMNENMKDAPAGIIPETEEELLTHPVIQMVFDMDLPENTESSWHSTVGFAIQALVKFSGLPYYGAIQDLEKDIAQTWGVTLSLKHCNADNVYGPLKAASNFAKKNGYDKYVTLIQNLFIGR